jgi:hypothetical protein
MLVTRGNRFSRHILRGKTFYKFEPMHREFAEMTLNKQGDNGWQCALYLLSGQLLFRAVAPLSEVKWNR